MRKATEITSVESNFLSFGSFTIYFRNEGKIKFLVEFMIIKKHGKHNKKNYFSFTGFLIAEFINLMHSFINLSYGFLTMNYIF